MFGLVGSGLTTLSYQHWLWQMSGALVWLQEAPPAVVTKTPMLVREPLLPSAIEA